MIALYCHSVVLIGLNRVEMPGKHTSIIVHLNLKRVSKFKFSKSALVNGYNGSLNLWFFKYGL